MNVKTLTIAEVKALKGKELGTAAAELNIAGRSKMKAEDLRMQIASLLGLPWDGPLTAESNAEAPAEVDAPTAEDEAKLDAWHVQPNRADRRRFLKARGQLGQQKGFTISKQRERGSQTGKQGQPLIMGMHYKGRAMGAKHYALIKAAALAGV